MNKRVPAVLAVCLLAPTLTTAQKIVKWTDAQGQVHFSDHAPPGQDATPVVVQAAPRFTPAPTVTRSGPEPAQAAPDSEAARRAVAAQEQQRRWDEQNRAAAAARLQADKAAIAQCKADRNTYCNQSADGIRKQEHLIAELQYADAVTHRQELADRGIYTPPPPAPPQLNTSSYPTPTNKVCKKKDCSDVLGHRQN